MEFAFGRFAAIAHPIEAAAAHGAIRADSRSFRDARQTTAEHMKDPIDEIQQAVHSTPEERRLRRVSSANAFRAIKAQHSARLTRVERIADVLTRVASSTPFLVSHIIWFAAWISWNSGAFGLRAFDPFPFGLLTLVVSLEAIFLSIFVLLAQGREASIAELREEVTLQVNLRTEAEVTKVLQLLAGLYTRQGYRLSDDAELKQMLQPLDPSDIERELIEQIRSTRPGKRAPR